MLKGAGPPGLAANKKGDKLRQEEHVGAEKAMALAGLRRLASQVIG